MTLSSMPLSPKSMQGPSYWAEKGLGLNCATGLEFTLLRAASETLFPGIGWGGLVTPFPGPKNGRERMGLRVWPLPSSVHDLFLGLFLIPHDPTLLF